MSPTPTVFSRIVEIDTFDHLIRAIDYGGDQGRRVFVEQIGSPGRGPGVNLDLDPGEALELGNALLEAAKDDAE
jgi:hypothetical protein